MDRCAGLKQTSGTQFRWPLHLRGETVVRRKPSTAGVPMKCTRARVLGSQRRLQIERGLIGKTNIIGY